MTVTDGPQSGHTDAPQATYTSQLFDRVTEMLPGLNSDERLELLGVMDEDDMRASLAWLVSCAPQMFDFALVRDRALVERLQERLDGAQDEGDLEPHCSECGATIGIFMGQQDKGWQHFREGTAESRTEIYDAGHAPALSWAPAGAR